MQRTLLFASTVALALSPALAFAHPGHGSGSGHELVHYLAEPLHAYFIAGVPIAAAALLVLLRRRRSRE